MQDAKNPQSQKDASDARMTSRCGGSPYLFGSAWSAEGFTWIEGDVGADNRLALRLAQRLGFRVTDIAGSALVKRVTLPTLNLQQARTKTA
jgi:hypothetical protein